MSLYTEIDGEGAVAVDIFYRKVLKDDRIKGFFDDVDIGNRESSKRLF